MTRKLALKRLTASDLTLFKWHFQNRPAGKQKAFNLDARILVDKLYPALSKPSDVPFPRYRLDLYLLGPGLAPAINLQRKILKQQKNWRLNGEFIDNPVDAPTRYNILSPGDFALLEFSGEDKPETAKVVLIAAHEPADAALHAELSRRYPTGSMWLIQANTVSEIIEVSALPQGHPLYDWVEGDVVEDAVLGGAVGIAKINKRRAGRGISPEDFIRLRQAAEKTGITGEGLLSEYFEQQEDAGEIEEFEWTSSINSISPFDFRIRTDVNSVRLVEVKSTSGGFGNLMHVSLGELYQAARGGEPYDIFRVYNVTDDSGRLRVARNSGITLEPILQAIEALPAGVTVDAISIRPEMLPFSEDEIVLGSSADKETAEDGSIPQDSSSID